MAIKKTIEESFCVDGNPPTAMAHVKAALLAGGFTNVEVSESPMEARGNYKKLTVWGTLLVSLSAAANGRTRVDACATANVDNVYAAFRSPGRKIIDQFRNHLDRAASVPAGSGGRRRGPKSESGLR